MSDPQTMDAMIRLRAARDPAKPMVVDAGAQLSYGDLDAGTRRVAAGLIRAGVGKGSRVGLVMPNSCEWVRIALALTRIGAVLVPLSTLLTGGELAAQLRTAAVSHLIAVDEFRGHRYEADLARDGISALRETWTPERALRLPRDRVGDDLVGAMAATVTPSVTLVIIFTSGSSGATVYPGEVEDALRTIPGIDGVAVTTVPGPVGNAVGAMVVCDSPALTVEDLRVAARTLLSSFKVPTVWALVPTPDAIPRGATGKVDVARLRALLSGGGTSSGVLRRDRHDGC